MSFVHDDQDFDALVRIVADKRGLSVVLVEKDYWVTHTLWTLLQSGFEVWLKGGTSLSKGFSLIERFSEDLDLKIEPGRVVDVAPVRSWTSEGTSATRERETYFSSLASNLDVAGADVVLEIESADRFWRSANLRVVFPQHQQDELATILRPFVLLEVGSARVVPFVARDMTSFVHEELDELGQLADFKDNRPTGVRCVHPVVTLIEKLDALQRRASNDTIEPAAFVRHFEDAAGIVRTGESLTSLSPSVNARALASEMVEKRQIRSVPSSTDPAFGIAATHRGDAIRAAYESIGPMFWGERIPLEEACAAIRAWIHRTLE